MVHKIAWGMSLVFGGLLVWGIPIPLIAALTGIALIVAGVAYMVGV